jgi:Xaa-Pro aminopeptidase
LRFAGKARTAKIQRICEQLAAQNVHAQLISALDDIAWTLNLRGSDVEYNPVAISYLVISRDAVRLFMNAVKIPSDVRAELESDGIRICAYGEIYSYLENLSPETVVLIDPDKTSYKLEQILARTCRTIRGTSVPSRLKAIKNETERNGIRQAHIRDGVAVVKWMYWLNQQMFKNHHTEITLAEKLDEFRCAGDHFQGPSFGTIVGYQANSAVGHYRAHADTTPTIQREGILLVDSGGQYLDGTTDITRSLTLGNPTLEQKRAFTFVLRGLIRLSQAKFPKGTQGKELDALAREPLWQQGWNCRHGIGHGVGYFLNVHEGPQRFSATNTIAFETGMVASNEPGVYFEGRFGIRLENVLLTISKGVTEFGGFLGFVTVTLCPIDLNLVESSLLSDAEKKWLNEYHQRVFEALSPFLTLEQNEWLRDATRAI